MKQTYSIMQTVFDQSLDESVQLERNPLRLFLMGLGYAGISLVLMHSWRVAQAGALSMFLTAAALMPAFNAVMSANREAIWTFGQDPRAANRRTAFAVLALFLGMTVAYGITAIVLPKDTLHDSFRFALDAARLGEDTILTRRFGSPLGLFQHNARVMISFLALAFIYRGYGALLALTWNAALWGVVITLMVHRAIGTTDTSPVVLVLMSAAAVLPHLILEAFAYTLASLAAIFTSKGLVKYGFGGERFKPVLASSARLIVVAVVTLAIAAATEHFVAAAVLASIQ